MLHCNGIDPFVTLMGNFNWGPISRNDIVSSRIYDTHNLCQNIILSNGCFPKRIYDGMFENCQLFIVSASIYGHNHLRIEFIVHFCQVGFFILENRLR